MANFKKEDKASIIARLEALEKKVEGLEGDVVSGVSPAVAPISTVTTTFPSVSSIGISSPGPINPAPLSTIPSVPHKCEVSDCGSMNTKEYQGVEMKMWLCDTHKF